MTGSNVNRPASKPISVEQYNRLFGVTSDPAGVTPRPRRTTSKATAKTGGTRRGVQRTPTTKPAKKKTPNRAALKVAASGVSPGFAPATELSRGPWTVAVDWLGRPLTYNDERGSSMGRATMAGVRASGRNWKEAFIEVIRHVGIPPQARVFVVEQAYYDNNNVPDPDGFAPTHKDIHDALVLAGVLPQDKRRNLPFGYYPLPPVTDGGPPRVAFTIFPLAED